MIDNKYNQTLNLLLGIAVTLVLVACAEQESAQTSIQQSTVTINESSTVPASNRVHEKTLANGLRVIVKEDHRSPVVVSQVWYKVGSSYEPDGITGVSHVLEHMMFKGTDKYGPNEASRIIAANGGSENAFTGQDYTAYFQQWEKSRLPLSFEIESNRMRNLQLAQEEFVKEIEVVKEERRMRTDDNPNAWLQEQFGFEAWKASPYGQPIIGWRRDLDSMTVPDLADWYRRYYAPNNATLIVVGDVNPDEVFSLAEHWFGSLEPSIVEENNPEPEPRFASGRDTIVERAARVPSFIRGYYAPVIDTSQPDDWEPYALEVLAYVLDGGQSARFEKTLVRKSQLAASIWTSYDATARLDGMISFGGSPSQGVSTEELIIALEEQLEQIKTELVSQQELDRVKAQLKAADVFERDSVFYQAMKIGRLVTIGLDWNLEEQWLEKISTVTAEQVLAVAQKYLVQNNSTTVKLSPLMAGSESASVEGGS
ncbi:MAG: insulinase family protein [Proteobacteria bacterium]|nr:insulinase family protein [Pseudomonadota bacterium]